MIFGGKTLAVSGIVLAGWFSSSDGGTKDDFDECTIKNSTLSSSHDSFKGVWNMCIGKHQKPVVLEDQDSLTVNGHPVAVVDALGDEHYVLKVTVKNKSDDIFITSFKARFEIPNGAGLIKTFDNLMLLDEGKEISVPIDHAHYLEMMGFLKLQPEQPEHAPASLQAQITDIKGLDADDD